MLWFKKQQNIYLPEVNILKEFVKEKIVECIVWLPDELMIADILTKEKVTKIGVMEMFCYGELNVVRNRENLITFENEDFVMKGRHLRKQIIKSKGIPMKKKAKAKEVAKDEAKNVEKEDGEVIDGNDVMFVRIEDKWLLDDTYKIKD